MKRFFRFFHTEIGGLHEAAYLLGVATIASQLLALVRDRLLAHTFGAGTELDLYYAAFRVPDIIFATIASFVSVNVLIPFLVQWIGPGSTEDKKRAQAFLSNVLTAFVIVMVLTLGIVVTFAPGLAHFVAPGFTGTEQEKLVLLMRILMLSPFFLGLSSIVGCVTQSLKRFYLYALSPLVYNLGIIVGIVVFYPLFGLPGLAMGVVLGAILHGAIQLPLLKAARVYPNLSSKINWQELKTIIGLSFPRTLALSFSQISIAALVSLASYMPKGSIAVFTFSFNLFSVPLSLIGASYSVAAFPTLARLFAQGEKEKYVRQVATATRHIIFLSLPLTALFIVLRAHIVRTVLGSGAFNWSDTRLTAAGLALFVIAIFSESLILLLVRAYYAAGNTSRPIAIDLVGSLFTIAGGYFFVHLFLSNPVFASWLEAVFRVQGLPGSNVLALPLGFVVGSVLNAIILAFMFGRDFPGFSKGIGTTVVQSAGGAIITAAGAYYGLFVLEQLFSLNNLLSVFLIGLCAGIFGIILGTLALLLLKNKEALEIQEQLSRRVFKTV